MAGMESSPGPRTTIDGRRCLYFAGTGYFGLHGHPEVIQAGVETFRRFGTHSATSRAGFGNNPVLQRVEELLKEYFASEDAAYFGSGYLSGLVLVQGLADRYETIFFDESAHFSLRDAVASAGKPVLSFRHRDPADLVKKIRAKLKRRERPLVLSDGVFPTFGRIAPLPDYAAIVAPYEGIIGIDDAHGVGVLGPNGRGTGEHFGLAADRYHLVATLSKAFGGHGGFVIGGRGLISRIRTNVGAYIGSTPTPTPIAAAAAKGIEILLAHPEMRQRLRENVAALKKGMKKLGLPADETPVPIVAWSLRSERTMRKLQQELMRRGIAVAYLKYAGAPRCGVLRVTVFSTHTRGQIRRLLEELGRLV
jgi:7-keto-8-aminopelargonate synthetase-like enzyme